VKLRRVVVVLFAAAAVPLGTALGAAAAAVTMPGTRPMRLMWVQGDGAPPAEFRVVEFPASDDVAVYTKPDGSRTGVLNRALLNSVAESEASWIAVRGEGTFWVRREDLSRRLDHPDRDALLEALVEAMRSRPGAIREQTWIAAERTDGGHNVWITLVTADEYRAWAYTERDGIVTPLEYSYGNRMTAAAARIDRMLLGGSLGAAGGLGATAMVLIVAYSRRPAAPA
jgi:hypothetical protein